MTDANGGGQQLSNALEIIVTTSVKFTKSDPDPTPGLLVINTTVTKSLRKQHNTLVINVPQFYVRIWESW